VDAQLDKARALVKQNETELAAEVYRNLIKADVPEAMYEYSNLALHGKYDGLPCEEATRLLQEASNKGYVPAKRTLGFLYLFAENEQVLQVSNYDRCRHEKNMARGTKLLMEAVLAGDSTAGRWLEQHRQDEGSN
jgi:serine/threonine-protein kinase